MIVQGTAAWSQPQYNWGHAKSAAEVFTLHDSFHSNLFSKASQKLIELTTLEANWDGHGGQQISKDAIEYCKNMLEQVLDDEQACSPQIVPLSYGGVQIEWHSLSGDLEIEIERPALIHVFFEDTEGRHEEWSGTTDFTRIEQILDRL